MYVLLTILSARLVPQSFFIEKIWANFSQTQFGTLFKFVRKYPNNLPKTFFSNIVVHLMIKAYLAAYFFAQPEKLIDINQCLNLRQLSLVLAYINYTLQNWC